MVKIPFDIKQFIEEQGVIVIGSVGSSHLPNVSPRIFFKVEDESIFWLDFFQHKSYKNFKVNPWVTLAVFDKVSLKGYQFRGTVNFITNEPTKSEIKDLIVKDSLKRNSSEKIKKLAEKDGMVLQFEIKVCYSLNPEEYTDMCIGSDIDSTQLFQK